jgi:hypothetical protein
MPLLRTLALEDVALAVMEHLGFIAEAQLGQQRERAGNPISTAPSVATSSAPTATA